MCHSASMSERVTIHWHLTHWGRVTHICVGNLTIIGPDNGLSPGRCQAIIWTNAGILLIGPWGTNFSEILIGIHKFSFKKINLKMSSAKWRPFCLGLNVLINRTNMWERSTGACLNITTVLLYLGIYIIKVRQSWDCLIFIAGIPILVRRHLYIEMAHRLQFSLIIFNTFCTDSEAGIFQAN